MSTCSSRISVSRRSSGPENAVSSTTKLESTPAPAPPPPAPFVSGEKVCVVAVRGPSGRRRVVSAQLAHLHQPLCERWKGEGSRPAKQDPAEGERRQHP